MSAGRERAERAARTESLSRDVNEEIQDTARGFGVTAGEELSFSLVCECSDPECNAPILVSDNAYEAVRAHGARFFLIDGHELPAVEHVVERVGPYVVVEKTGHAGRFAKDHDPRREV